VQDQWISLQHDPCDSYDYLGICADCQQEEAKREAASKMEGNGGQQPVNGELLETLRFLVQEVQQPELADSYVGDAVKKARVVLGKYAAGGKTDVETTGHEMGLTDEQVEHAKEDGVTTAVGLRRIEKNTRADEVPETIACARCDVESPESLAAALQEGWTELCRDDGAGWNYLGVCPECQAQEDQVPEGDATEAQEQKRLFG
jgi:hypothetical protein